MADKAEKKAFVLRLRADMQKALEEWAAEEFRSTNGQIEFLLAQALARRKRNRGKPDLNQ